MPVTSYNPLRMWTAKLKTSMPNQMIRLVRALAVKIITDHHSGQTEAFYEKMISSHLYERGIPYITQVDCFVQQGQTPIHVGRLDMEINHDTIIELKVGAKIRSADISQLMKYVRSRQSTGMVVRNAAVVCFRENDTVEIWEAPPQHRHHGDSDSSQSSFFSDPELIPDHHREHREHREQRSEDLEHIEHLGHPSSP